MKCPNCDFVVATKKDICPKCDLDLRPFKKEQGIKISDPNSSVDVLRRREKHAQSQSDQLNELKRETIHGRGTSIEQLPLSEFSEKTSIARMRVLAALDQVIATPIAPLQPEKLAPTPHEIPETPTATHEAEIAPPIAISAEELHAQTAPLNSIQENQPLAADVFAEPQTPQAPPLPTVEQPAAATSKILSTETIETFSKVLDELGASLQANIEKARTATQSISEKEYFQDTNSETQQPAQITAPRSTAELKTVAEVISFLELKQKSELRHELQLLEAALLQLNTAQSVPKVANSSATISSEPIVVTSATARDTTLTIDNTSLLDALREYDQATGFDSALESLESDEILEAETQQQNASDNQDLLEEPEFPSAKARLGALVIDSIAILGISALASLVFIPTPIAKLMFLDLQPQNLEALPHIATYLYALIATLLAYNTVLTTAGMQTIGAKLFAIEVLNDQRFELSFPQALLRALCILVTTLSCGLGFLPALVKRRTLHEVLSQTFTQTLIPIVLTDHEVFKKKVYDIEEI